MPEVRHYLHRAHDRGPAVEGCRYRVGYQGTVVRGLQWRDVPTLVSDLGAASSGQLVLLGT